MGCDFVFPQDERVSLAFVIPFSASAGVVGLKHFSLLTSRISGDSLFPFLSSLSKVLAVANIAYHTILSININFRIIRQLSTTCTYRDKLWMAILQERRGFSSFVSILPPGGRGVRRAVARGGRDRGGSRYAQTCARHSRAFPFGKTCFKIFSICVCCNIISETSILYKSRVFR
jgi:hypothetical protein